VSMQSSFADLSRQQADVAIRFGDKPRQGDVVAKHIARVGVGFYGSKSYFRKHGRPASLDELSSHAIVRGDPNMAGLVMERVIDRVITSGQVAFRSDSMLARLHAIRNGIGVGFLSYFAAETERSLERIDLTTPDLSADLWMLIHVDVRRNARVRAFVDFAYDALVAQRHRFTSTARRSGQLNNKAK
jgi:DNA-binding transcriptional LysR family regulator